MNRIEIYTDGGARPNPGPGGWGAVVLYPDGRRAELSGGEEKTTNNRMELSAAIHALEAHNAADELDLFTDSTYLRNGVTRWLPGWIARGWRRADDGEVKNRDLWQRLSDLQAKRQVRWHWLKGHAGHEHNERADELATAEIDQRTTEDAQSTEGDLDGSDGIHVYVKVRCAQGHGRWLALVVSEDEQIQLDGGGSETTANRLELEAGIELLDRIETDEPLTIHAGDYLSKGAGQWRTGWKRAGWRTATGSPVKNVDLWRKLDRLLGDRDVQWAGIPKTGPLASELKTRMKELGRPLMLG